jgi:hypothetical protein
MATTRFIQHAFDEQGREMSRGIDFREPPERVQVVLNYPKNSKVTISGDGAVVAQILRRLDLQVIECKL